MVWVTVGTLPMLFSLALVGPGDIVHASSSLSSPSSGSGTCSIATFDSIFSLSSLSSASASRILPVLLLNGHAISIPPCYREINSQQQATSDNWGSIIVDTKLQHFVGGSTVFYMQIKRHFAVCSTYCRSCANTRSNHDLVWICN